jgi:predicted dienelactone hydrolase
MRRAGWALAMTFTGACRPGTDAAEAPASCAVQTAVAPDLSAPAGVRQFATTWTVPWSGEVRTIPLTMWYPTDATTGEAAKWLSFFPDPASLVDAPLRAPTADCTYPVAVYSHGYQGYGGVAAELARHLTRQGWVVVAPDHTGNTLNGDTPHDPTFSLVRAMDLSAALDAVEALPEDDPLAGRLDTSAVLAFGHSFGGETTWLVGGAVPQEETVASRCANDACGPGGAAAMRTGATDPRVAALAPMAGAADGLVSVDGYAGMRGPVRQYTGSADFPAQAQFALATEARIAMTWLHVTGACHNSFITSPFGCETLAHATGMTWLAADLGAFASSAVLGSDDPEVAAILAGDVPAEVEVERQATGG